jgi:hypothetical protein
VTVHALLSSRGQFVDKIFKFTTFTTISYVTNLQKPPKNEKKLKAVLSMVQLITPLNRALG